MQSLRGLERVVRIVGQNGEVAHFSAFARGFFTVKMQMCVQVALQRQPFGFAAVFLPNVAQNIRHTARTQQFSVSRRQVAHQADLLLKLVCRAGVDGMVAGVVRTRRDFVDDQFMCIADNKHFYRQYADVVQFIGQTLRHLPRLLLNVGTQSGRDDGVGEDAVFVNVFGRVEGLHVIIVQTAYDNGNFAAQIHHFSKTQSTPPCSANAALSSSTVLTRIWPLPS